MKRLTALISVFWLTAFSISAKTLGTVRVENPYDFNRDNEIVETENRFGKDFHIVELSGKPVTYQITYDGKLIFPVSVAANDVAEYKIT